MVHRRPSRSPRKVQERAPNVPKRVYRATTVPDYCFGKIFIVMEEIRIDTLDRRVVMLLGSRREDGVEVRKLLVKRSRRQDTSCTCLVVPENYDYGAISVFENVHKLFL